ncbi:FAD-binding domain-containing protein [Rhizopogon vinicolor AM-OR11-026]|uniref:FAD-binding domain-containing protein n=1 Tax=Rhizopogon vinicolor AM-OR11-026 TaxID=1314800 RepID=A0A1B7MGV8_9AGAM|nr:FAD-binding domain-containing protein [Rhizopogon vinicolor AM-OR11-026]
MYTIPDLDALKFSSPETQLSNPLIYPRPAAVACYPVDAPSGNCSALALEWDDGNWRSDQPGVMQAPNFETYIFNNGTIDACYLDTSLGVPCSQGSVPIIGVNATTSEDVQAAVKFAVKHNPKLAVKNTGHDYLGRSTNRGSFVVWTHHMKNTTYNPSFIPQGAPPNETYDAITLEAGVQWHETYDALEAYDRLMIGGSSIGGSVGAAGGWVLGGGHSVLSPTFGLGIDNVVKMTIILSTGQYLTINTYQYPDLFWALRGGGGGTYRILTSVTYRTYAPLPVTAVFFTADTESANTTQAFSPSSCASPRSSPMQAGQDLVAVQPYFQYAANMTGVISQQTYVLQYPSWYSWYAQFYTNGTQNGANVLIGSRLLTRDVLETKYQELSDIMFPLGSVLDFVAGGKVSEIDPDSVGVNPAWRNAVLHATFGISWPEGASSQEVQEIIDGVTQVENQLRELTPISSAYFNEASLWEEDWQYTFFRDHYAALKLIKDRYDPYRLFVVAEGVGSEDWDQDLRCRL